MSLDHKLEEIRKACILANPAIMELGFGCEIVLDLNGAKGYFLGSTPDFPSGWFKIDDGIYPVGGKGGHTFEILGRPVRLADVLLAIRKQENISTYTKAVSNLLFTNHKSEDFSSNQNNLEWKFLKDDLRSQSEETISFIHSLLTK